jgi:hypothetical protein
MGATGASRPFWRCSGAGVHDNGTSSAGWLADALGWSAPRAGADEFGDCYSAMASSVGLGPAALMMV